MNNNNVCIYLGVNYILSVIFDLIWFDLNQIVVVVVVVVNFCTRETKDDCNFAFSNYHMTFVFSGVATVTAVVWQ